MPEKIVIDAALAHFQYLTKLQDKEPIRDSTQEYYRRNVAGKQPTEIEDPMLLMFKNAFEMCAAGKRESFKRFIMFESRESEQGSGVNPAQMGAMGTAYQFQTLQASNAVNAIRDVMQTAISSIKDMAKDNSNAKAIETIVTGFGNLLEKNNDALDNERKENNRLRRMVERYQSAEQTARQVKFDKDDQIRRLQKDLEAKQIEHNEILELAASLDEKTGTEEDEVFLGMKKATFEAIKNIGPQLAEGKEQLEALLTLFTKKKDRQIEEKKAEEKKEEKAAS